MEERDPVVDEVREQFVLKTHQERVLRLEAENKELRVNNSILHTQFKSHWETQSEITKTLYSNLEEYNQQIEELDKTKERLQKELEDERQQFKDRLEEERMQWDTQVQKVQANCDYLQAKLNEMDEFIRNKDSLEQELAQAKKDLIEQREAHEAAISAFDRKKAIDIDKKEKDMQQKIKETREVLKAKIKDQLDFTTKRTIMENEQMANELQYQSKKTEQILERNEALEEENAALRRQLQIHKDLENELARRTHMYQKLIKKLNQRPQPVPTESTREREFPMEESVEDHGNSDESLLGGPSGPQPSASVQSSLGEENDQLKKQLESAKNTLQMVRQEFAQYRRDHSTLTQLQDQSTRLVIAALYELKNQRECTPFPPASYDENANWQFTNMTSRQKEYFFRVLLEKLNSSMCGSCFPTGHAGHVHSPQQSTTSLPALGKGPQSEQGGNSFSQFLWSVASNGPTPPPPRGMGRRDLANKAMQTETDASDPCFKEGLWDPTLKQQRVVSNVTPAMVTAPVRSWGSPAVSVKPRGRSRIT